MTISPDATLTSTQLPLSNAKVESMRVRSRSRCARSGAGTVAMVAAAARASMVKRVLRFMIGIRLGKSCSAVRGNGRHSAQQLQLGVVGVREAVHQEGARRIFRERGLALGDRGVDQLQVLLEHADRDGVEFLAAFVDDLAHAADLGVDRLLGGRAGGLKAPRLDGDARK